MTRGREGRFDAAMKFQIHWSTDTAVRVVLDGEVTPASVIGLDALADQLRTAELAGIQQVISAYRAITIVIGSNFEHQQLEAWLSKTKDLPSRPQGILHEVRACFCEQCALDREVAVSVSRRSWDEFLSAYLAQEFTVLLIGFQPGFPFLGPLPEELHLPRREEPRVRVPAGSIGIGGRQTGIYPREGPGGWQLIGRTPWQLFDPSRPDPLALHPGDRVRFQPISMQEFERSSFAKATEDRCSPSI